MTRVALLWTLLALVAAGSRAEVVADLHSATVPVGNQSSQALATAAREALADVLVKVSGSRDLLQNPVITAALAEARDHVQQYAYIRAQPPAAALSVTFEFDGAFITELVRRAGAPLWTANRPLVLAWVVVEDAQGRHFVNWDGAREEAQLLENEFSRRGVPVQIPVFDLADTAVSPEDVWRLDQAVIQTASARYQSRDIVVGRLGSVNDGKALGDWSYFHQDDRIDRSVTVPDLQSFLRDGVNVVAGALAARYAVAPTAGDQVGVRVSVTGVTDYADYAAIIRWLEGLELVKYANLEQVQGDRIELRLQAQADASQLAAIIELNDRLLPLPVSEPGTSAQLNYQWRK
ncbi:MAG TPA: DUF2066 domain-containing protein [Halioglobus sp.]